VEGGLVVIARLHAARRRPTVAAKLPGALVRSPGGESTVLRSVASAALAASISLGAQAQTAAELRSAVASLPLTEDESCILVVLPGAGTPASGEEVKRLRPLVLTAVRTRVAAAVQVPAPKGADAGELLGLMKESSAQVMVVASVFAATDGSDVVLQVVSAGGKVLGTSNVNRARPPADEAEAKRTPAAEPTTPSGPVAPPSEPAPSVGPRTWTLDETALSAYHSKHLIKTISTQVEQMPASRRYSPMMAPSFISRFTQSSLTCGTLMHR